MKSQYIELNIKTDLWEGSDGRKKDKLIKKGIITKIQVELDELSLPEQIFNRRGNVVKNECKVFITDRGPTIVGHSYDFITSLRKEIENKRKEIGFDYSNKNKKVNTKRKK